MPSSLYVNSLTANCTFVGSLVPTSNVEPSICVPGEYRPPAVVVCVIQPPVISESLVNIVGHLHQKVDPHIRIQLLYFHCYH